MTPARACTLRLTPFLFWLLFHVGHVSEGEEHTEMERAGSDTTATRAPTNVPSDSVPKQIMGEVELLSDLDILIDLEFLALLEMLEAEELSLSDSLHEEAHRDSN
jgi:hypothetical protein